METEADLYAIRAMRKYRLDPTELLAILQRLEQGEGAKEDGEKGEVGLLGYLSTHPLGEARLTPLRAAIGD